MNPEQAWTPLPQQDWHQEAARHLASRIGFSVRPSIVAAIEEMGLSHSLTKAFGQIRPIPRPGEIADMDDSMGDYQQMVQEADPAEKRKLRQNLQKKRQRSYQEFAIDWYSFARDQDNSAQEKLVLFFENVWVVAFQGVRSPSALFEYQESVRKNLSKSYPEMCKALSISPAMVRYLNLNQNRKGSPNENFARELFELFCLGEGNYTEQDIKEAARAFTGYTVNQVDEVRFFKKRHDSNKKTIFGKTGHFDLPGVIDLIFEQPSAARFLPQELVRYYLTDEGLSDEMIQPLADSWKASGYSISHLISTFFRSRIFFDPAYRGNMIKSPVQYYLGLLQDFDLDVFPSPRRSLNMLRSMGQPFYNPPNVRGWVQGRHWINSATLSARRQMVQNLMNPVPRKLLNADEERAIEAAVAAGHGKFTIPKELLNSFAAMSLDDLAETLANRYHIQPHPENFRKMLDQFPAHRGNRRVTAAILATALTAPAYQLC